MIKYTLEIDGRIILNETSYSIFIAECIRYLNSDLLTKKIKTNVTPTYSK